MWILFAFGSAFFAGVTSIFAKLGMKEVDSRVATAIRTVVVLLFSCLVVRITGSWITIAEIDAKSFAFLIFSGFTTGASWLCYFQALQIGDVGKVVIIDKSSTILTMFMPFAFLGETATKLNISCIMAIGVGTYLIARQKTRVPKKNGGHKWLFYASLSAIFASMTSILAKIGISDIDSNLGTTVRTVIVLVMAWGIVFFSKKGYELKKISNRDVMFLCLSGTATGASWLCFYKALHDGPASIVVPIDKLSVLFTIGFSCIAFNEKLTKSTLFGLALIVFGTIALLI
jgi:transporter family protein